MLHDQRVRARKERGLMMVKSAERPAALRGVSKLVRGEASRERSEDHRGLTICAGN